jgi:hypothetical protein
MNLNKEMSLVQKKNILGKKNVFSVLALIPFIYSEAMEFIEWGPSKERVFSTTGCKRISQKVGTIVAKYNLRRL